MRFAIVPVIIASALSVLAGVAWGELPRPENPLWTPVRDDVYLQEVGRTIETPEPLLAVAVLDSVAYIGNAHGVHRLDGDTLTAAGGPAESVRRLKSLNGALWAFPERGLWRFAKGEWTKLSDETFVDACTHLGDVVIASPTHLYKLEGDVLAPLHDNPPPTPIRGVASYAETLYIRHDDRLAFLHGGTFQYYFVNDWGHLPLGSIVRDAMTLGGRLLVATDKGLAQLRGMSFVTLTGKDGLCYEDTTCVAKGFEKDDFWIGAKRGAIRAVNGEFHYFGYQRWIPHDRVNAIACGDRVAYIATDGGMGIVSYEPYTLQKKAAWYERWIDEWGMRRLGFISSLTWDAQRNEWIRFISDNDGGWAAHLLNAYCFKYAVTKDPNVREQAVDVFRTLRWCEQISSIPGFPARAIATVGEPSMLAETGSAGLPSEWNPTPDGKWLWKGDTSSDEVDAHMQSTMIFYELVAQGKEKDAAREHLRRIVGHIVDNGWVLRDLDGKPTRWARWDPEYLQRPYGYEARGLNGMEALSMVTLTHAITGDEKFNAARQQLLDWGYHNEVLRQKLVFPVVTHFDDRLAFLAYHPLLTYERDPALRSIYRRSLERSWEVKRIETMPWFNYLYGALTGNEMDNARALKNLQEWPLDCRNYTYVNSCRADLQVPDGFINYVCDWKSMSARNIGPSRWDNDFLRLDGGGGKSVADPSAFLDAYWMARYYGMVLPPETKDRNLIDVDRSGRQLGAKPYDGPQRPDVGF
ncbi:MAG: hypothetical protein HUU46_17410 [Candidatus Hydrogenedentes bacterium]|nr:hypothetical protein [Candidatus Hydrogenedentota bacterium]